MATKGSNVDIVEQAVHWAASNGLTMLAKRDGKIDGIQHCPMTLEPFQLPKSAFVKALDYALPFNKMADAVARDVKFLHSVLEGVEKSDEFTANLLKISRKLHEEEGGLRQKIALAFNRSDYMLNEADGEMLQVELNTISASFGVLSTRISELHRFLQARFGQSEGAQLPKNNVVEGLANAIAEAHKLYSLNHASSTDVVVVFVVQGGETNISDQRPVEYKLFGKHNVRVVRLTLAEIKARTALDDGRLVLDGAQEVSVVYFRAGYTPNDYPTQDEWDAREIVERSLAIKCPNVDYQLVGTKKVQQVLVSKAVLAKYSPAADVELLSKSMAGIWALGDAEDVDDEARAARAAAIASPEKYVVKPQREGGGNNFYGDDVKRILEEKDDSELAAYILMQRIFPPSAATTLIRNGTATKGEAICEVGVYAPYLGDGERVYLNEIVGHLVRTKFVGVDEGGVASGYACLSSPALVEK